jgi:hypothetical protein
MPNELHQRLNALLASIGFNDGANKGFWRVQPREKVGEDAGQWIEMGAELRMFYKNQRGETASVPGRAVGSTGTPDGVRVLVQGQEDVPDGIYGADTANVRISEAILPEKLLEEQGIENKPQLDKDQEALLPTLEQMERSDITEDDIRLINEGAASNEAKQHEEYRKSVEAEEQKAKETPADVEPELKPATEKWLSDPKNDGKQIFYIRNGKVRLAWVSDYDGYIYKGPAPVDPAEGGEGLGSIDEFLEALDNGTISGIYQGLPPYKDGKPLEGFEINRLASKQAEDRRKARAEAKAAKKPAAEEAPATPETSEQRDPIAEIFADVAYNGDTDQTLDDILNADKATTDEPADPRDSDPELKRTMPFSINVGDVIRDKNGNDSTVVDIKFDIDQGGVSTVRLQQADGSIGTFKFDPKKPFYKVKAKKGKPVKPAKPAPKPASETAKPATQKPEAPEAPEKPEAKPKPESKPEAAAPTKPENVSAPTPPPNFPPADRIDDGEEFEFEELSEEQQLAARKKKALPLMRPDGVPDYYVDENGDLKPASDPTSMMNILAEMYPNAKFTPDGLGLILARMKDKDGRIFELRASNAGMKAISYSMRWTDPNTGEVEELFHYDTRHSPTALFTKTNGADGLMERLFGTTDKWKNLSHGNWSAGPDASLRERAKWFTYKKKMFFAEQMTLLQAEGRSETYHVDSKNWGRVRKSEIKSTWDAVEALFTDRTNKEVLNEIYLRLEKIFGSIPMTDRAHKAALTAIRAEYKKRFAGREDAEADRTFTALVTNASMHAKGKSFSREKDPAYRANPYASGDRHNPIETGMVVEYENNVGDKSVVRVVGRVKNLNVLPSDKDSFDYQDYVVVVDANGRQRVLNALQLEILKDQNSPLTRYIPNLKGAALTQRRIEQGKIEAPGSKPSPVPGSTAVVEKPQPNYDQSQLVDDLNPGDTLLDFDGEPIGEIIAVEPTQDNEGNNGFAFLVVNEDGEEVVVFYPQGTEIDPKKA